MTNDKIFTTKLSLFIVNIFIDSHSLCYKLMSRNHQFWKLSIKFLAAECLDVTVQWFKLSIDIVRRAILWAWSSGDEDFLCLNTHRWFTVPCVCDWHINYLLFPIIESLSSHLKTYFYYFVINSTLQMIIFPSAVLSIGWTQFPQKKNRTETELKDKI